MRRYGRVHHSTVKNIPWRAIPIAPLPDGPEWQYEVKWDGYRMQTLKHGGKVWLVSRNGADFTGRFAAVAQAVSELKPATLHLDGELVAMDRQGHPSFQILQGRLPLPQGWGIGYYAFDLLRAGGRSLHQTPLSERREILQEVLKPGALKFSPRLEGNADQVISAVREHGLEGVVAKRLGSFYEAGKRSGAWVKLPLKSSGSFLIGGFRPAGKSFSVLLVGRFEGPRFNFAGKVRHEFGKCGRVEVLSALSQSRAGKCPFSNLPNCKADPFDEMVTPEEMTSFSWVKPEVAVEIAFAEWSRFGALRQAEFVGSCSGLRVSALRLSTINYQPSTPHTNGRKGSGSVR